MPNVETAQRLDCAHCETKGTCASGTEKSSCAVCIQRAKLNAPPSRWWLWWHLSAPAKSPTAEKPPTGLPCSVCGGVGKAEPKTLRFLNLFLPFFAAGFVALLLIWLLVLALVKSDSFQSFLTFAGTATGSVTGYYFGGTKHQPPS